MRKRGSDRAAGSAHYDSIRNSALATRWILESNHHLAGVLNKTNFPFSTQFLSSPSESQFLTLSGIASKIAVLLHHNLSSARVKLSRSVCFFTSVMSNRFPSSQAPSTDAESTGKRESGMSGRPSSGLYRCVRYAHGEVLVEKVGIWRVS